MPELQPDLLRAGRGLAGMNLGEFAKHSGIQRSTIANFEKQIRNPQPATLHCLLDALNELGIGVDFGNKDRGPGVYWKRKRPSKKHPK